MDYRLIFMPGRNRAHRFKKTVADLEYEVGFAVPLAEVLRQCMELFVEKGEIYGAVKSRIEGNGTSAADDDGVADPVEVM